MGDFTPDLAASYAEAVIDVLAAEFPALDETRLGSLGRLVQQDVAQQATAPARSFEVIVTYTREWRLVPDRTGEDRWRVQVGCFIDNATTADRQREQRINEALRAINPASLDATDRRSHG